jgi:hypothetical protein
VILVRGIPGSGKTTLVDAIVNLFFDDPEHPSFWGSERIAHFSADCYMVKDDGTYAFDSKRLSECHRACFRNFGSSLFGALGDPGSMLDVVLVHNTFTQKREMDPYLSCCRGTGKHLIVVNCEGGWNNVHGVPSDKVEAMRNRMEPLEGEIILSREDLESGNGAKLVYKHLINLCTKECEQ